MLYFGVYFWIVTLFLTLSYVYFQVKRKRLYELSSKLDGPPTLPILGNALKCIVSPEDVVEVALEGIKHYKSPTRIWLGPHLAVHIWDPKHIETVLTSRHLLRKEPLIYDFAKTIFGNGLICSPVEQWKHHRHVIAPAFSQKNLQATFDIFRKHSKKLVAELQPKEGKGIFDVEEYLLMTTMANISENILCFDSNTSNLNNTHLIEWLNVMQKIAVGRITNIWLQADFIFNRTKLGKRFNKIHKQYNNYIDSVMEEWKEDALRKNMHKSEPMVAKDVESTKPIKLVEHMLSASDEDGKLTNEEIREEVKTILAAGMETTAAATGFALIVLGMYPEIQQTLYEEIIDVIGPTRDFEYEDLKRLEYLDRVVKETLRMFPGGVGMARRSDQEIQLDEFTIPAGCTILIGLIGVHRDPNIWPNPSKFDPDRFLPEEVAKRHPHSWIPFSAGPRNCIGQRFAFLTIKTFLVDLLRTYKVSTTYKTIDEINLTYVFILKPKKGFTISLTSRCKC